MTSMKVLPTDGRTISYQLQYRKCGKPCKTCDEGRGHGPYWYAFWWTDEKKVGSKYVGKNKPEEVSDAKV